VRRNRQDAKCRQGSPRFLWLTQVKQSRREAERWKKECPLGLVIPNEVRNHYATDCAWNPGIVPPVVIPLFARNDKVEGVRQPKPPILPGSALRELISQDLRKDDGRWAMVEE
jgi:hypothetical protein